MQVCEHAMEDICGTKLLLERYMSPNFFGLFVEKEQEGLLKKLTQDLCKEIRKLGVKADPIIKSFHLTLAYQVKHDHLPMRQGGSGANSYGIDVLRVR